MVRMSKQEKRRAVSPRKHRPPCPKTGPKKDNLEAGYRKHENVANEEMAQSMFIPKM